MAVKRLVGGNLFSGVSDFELLMRFSIGLLSWLRFLLLLKMSIVERVRSSSFSVATFVGLVPTRSPTSFSPSDEVRFSLPVFRFAQDTEPSRLPDVLNGFLHVIAKVLRQNYLNSPSSFLGDLNQFRCFRFIWNLP